MNLLQKAGPFFEYIVLGLAFAGMGYAFFWTFNGNENPAFPVLGMAAVCFGGLKILIGLIIHGIWLFAVIFKPEYLKRKEEERMEKEAAKKKAEAEAKNRNDTYSDNPPPEPGWFQTNMPFVARHWGTLLEVTLLVMGLLIIVITRS